MKFGYLGCEFSESPKLKGEEAGVRSSSGTHLQDNFVQVMRLRLMRVPVYRIWHLIFVDWWYLSIRYLR